MAFSKSKFLTIFLLFCSLLQLGIAIEEVVDNPIAQSEIVGQRLPYAQDCCNYCHTGTCCGSGDYCNPPCLQNGCGCVENPSSRCCSGSICHPPPSCQCQGPCPSCGCVRSNVKVEGQHESNSDHPSSESMPPKHGGN